MFRIFSALSILLFLPLSLIAQNTCNLTVGTDIGLPVWGKYEQGRDILKPGIAVHYTPMIFFNTILSKRVGLEVGVGQNFQKVNFTDKAFFELHNEEYNMEMKHVNRYPHLEAALIYNQPLSQDRSMYFRLGYRWNYPGNKTQDQEAQFSPDGTNFYSHAYYPTESRGIAGEVGFRHSGGFPIVYGLKYYHGLTPTVYMDYTATQSQYTNTDRYVSKSSYIGFFVALSFEVFEWNYPNIKLKRKKKSKPEKEKPVPPAPSTLPDDRKEEVIETLTISDSIITVKIYDPNKEDNDIVSIWVNGEKVIADLVVYKKPYTQQLSLKKGENRIVFQAMNLGEYSPNTAEMILVADGKEHKLRFTTTLELNQVLIINIP